MKKRKQHYVPGSGSRRRALLTDATAIKNPHVAPEQKKNMLLLLKRGLAFRIDPPDELPDSWSDAAAAIVTLGEQHPGASPNGLASIVEKDREELVDSIANTLSRARYHELRFGRVVDMLAKRRISAGNASLDACARYAAYEATAMLAACRSCVDEILFIGGLRSGMSSALIAADRRWGVPKAIYDSKRPEYSLPEAAVLRKHVRWFESVNVYRNALTHFGSTRIVGGYVPISEIEHSRVELNAMMLPDFASVKAKQRRHEWTYNDGIRLEDLVKSWAAGFDACLWEVITLWGGTRQPAGLVSVEQHANIFIAIPHPAFLRLSSAVVACCFDSEARALDFAKRAKLPELSAIRILPTDPTIDHTPEKGFWIYLPGGAELATLQDFPRNGPLIIEYNPEMREDGFSHGTQIGSVEIAELLQEQMGVHMKIVASEGFEDLYLLAKQ